MISFLASLDKNNMHFCKHQIVYLACIMPLMLFAAHCFAKQEPSPVGQWVIVEHDQPTAIVAIKMNQAGQLSGKLISGAGKNTVLICQDCVGKLKNQSIVNLTILRDFVHTADRTWKKGNIFNPNDGKNYHCEIHVSEDGQELMVHGYVGILLLGKTEVWHRKT